MRCFACNLDLGPAAVMDRPTKRYYCTDCFEPTLQVQLAAASEDIDWYRISESETSFSFAAVSDILEEEGWEAVKEVVSLDEYLEEKNEDEEEEWS